ncbi:hypothetical protein MMC25_008086 [Agyrium rufum]|nr:hypothetical protein [Agyrium rufum]
MMVPRSYRHGMKDQPEQLPSSTKRSKTGIEGESGSQDTNHRSHALRLLQGTDISRGTPTESRVIATQPESRPTWTREGRADLRSARIAIKGSARRSNVLDYARHVDTCATGESIAQEGMFETVRTMGFAEDSHPRGKDIKRNRRRPIPPSKSSPRSWELLQAPFSMLTEEDGEIVFNEDIHLTLSSLPSSSDMSIGSLELDDSLSSSPSTFSLSSPSRRRSRRILSSSPSFSEDCGVQHPLSESAITGTVVDPTPLPLIALQAKTIPQRLRAASFISSNLTASVRVLKSAARSFGELTASLSQQDAFLTRSILSISPQFTDERRPTYVNEQNIADPALRRYLNPTTLSPAELHIHHDHAQRQAAKSKCTASIQLQMYERVEPHNKDGATAPPVFCPGSRQSEAGFTDVPAGPSGPRPREPRENSAFLRVIVLEMNMRKAGKLNEASPGRARIWLPPRQSPKDFGLRDARERWGEPLT